MGHDTNKILYTNQKSIIYDIQYGYKSDMMMMMMIVHCEKSAFISVNIHLWIPIYSFQTAHHISKPVFCHHFTVTPTTSIPPCWPQYTHNTLPVGSLTSSLSITTSCLSVLKEVCHLWNPYRKHKAWSYIKIFWKMPGSLYTALLCSPPVIV